MMTKHRQGRSSSVILDEVMRDDKKTLPDWMLAFQPLNYVHAMRGEGGYASIKKKHANVLAQPLKRRPALLGILKTMLGEGRGRLKAAFMESNDGAMYLGLHTLLMDDVVRLIYESACRIYGADMRLSVLATGGYGRGELCPHSDIDILFLTKVKPKRHEAEAIRFMLYLLWDLGLNVGHASRSLRQALRAAGDDLTIRTALLESRHVVGDADLSAELMAMFRAEITPAKAKNFIAEKLAERDLRHARSDSRRYMLEPHIKTGKGGLRDLQTLFWIARYSFGADTSAGTVAALIEKGFLTTAEARRFSMAQQFLWSLRCHLHFRCGREDDRLSFDAQMDIAPLFGFRARGGQKGVEAFMRRYFLAATSVGNLTRIFCGAIADDLTPVSAPVRVQESVRVQARAPVPFLLCGRHLLFDPNEKLSEHPNALLDVFLLALEKNYEIHATTLQQITRKLRLIDDAFRADAEANATFLAILTHKKNPERILRLMNEVGILGKFLPDFGRIVAMMQFNMYHSYTVDEHTIYALGVLHQIEAGALVDIAPVASNAVGKISERTALYVALLLHDIAKGRGDDHSTLGAEVARRLCPRLGLDDAAVETVAWLVQNHLLMSDTAFRYDLNDAATIDRFAQKVQSPERLNLLLVLTVADIRAVGPHVWNGFKAGLMRELYARTLAVLLGDAVVSSGQQEALRQALRGRDAYWDEARVQAHIDMFYPNYWSHFDLDAYLRHADMCRDYSVDAKSIGINIMPDQARNATEIAVLVTDHAGVLSRLAGGVAASGANIVDARVISRKDGLALDVLWVQDATRQAISDKEALLRLHTNIEKSMFGHLDIDTAMRARLRATPARMRRIAAPSRVLINNQISPTHTVIEINGKDAPGLLYRLTRALAEMGVQIQMASVSTYGNRVVDVFYVKDSFGLKLEAKARIKALEAALLKIVEDSDPSKRVAA